MAVSLATNPVDLHVGISAYLLTVAVFILTGGWDADRCRSVGWWSCALPTRRTFCAPSPAHLAGSGGAAVRAAIGWLHRRAPALATYLRGLGLAALTQSTPLALILQLLVVSGASRSTQFTALGTLVFADVSQDRMAPANTWCSVSFQLSTGIGVALGALILRLARAAVGSQTSPAAFRAAFATIAVITLLLATVASRLRPDAGAAVSGHGLASARAGSG